MAATTPQPAALEPAWLPAWASLLRVHSTLTRALNAQLVVDHGLTINDFDVLLQLARAPGHRLRRVDLAERVVLSPSGITRLLDGLERAGLVAKEPCASDARVVYAVLTEQGLAAFAEARASHLATVEQLFAAKLPADDLAALGRLLARLPGGGGPDTDCGPA